MPIKENNQENKSPEKDNPLKNTEMSLEDNYNNIDGVINNISAENKMTYSVLDKLCRNTELKIEKQKDKIAKLQKKEKKVKTKIKRLHKKHDNIKDEESYLKSLVKMNVLPKYLQSHFENSLARQTAKSEKFWNDLDNLKHKERDFSFRIAKCEDKIKNFQSEIDSIKKIDHFLSNMHSREGRRENFITAMTAVNKYSLDRTFEKSGKVGNKIEKATKQLEQATTGAKKFKLRNKIARLTTEKENLTARIEKLKDVTQKLEEFNQLPKEYDTQIDNAILQTADNIKNEVIDGEVIRSGNMTEILDTVVAQSEAPIKNVLDNKTPQEHTHSEKLYEIEATGKDEKINSPYFTFTEIEPAQRMFDRLSRDNNYSDIYFRELEFDKNSDISSEKTDKRKVLQEVHNDTEATNKTVADKKSVDLRTICDEIDKAISENFSNNRFHSEEVINTLSQKFDIRDVQSVVAIDVRNKGSYDGRIYRTSLEWANTQPISPNITELMKEKNLFLKSHTGLVNLLAQRIALNEKRGLDIRSAVSDTTKAQTKNKTRTQQQEITPQKKKGQSLE